MKDFVSFCSIFVPVFPSIQFFKTLWIFYESHWVSFCQTNLQLQICSRLSIFYFGLPVSLLRATTLKILRSPILSNKEDLQGKPLRSLESLCMFGITDSMDVSLSELRELVRNREAWRAVIHGVTMTRTWLSDWTELNWTEDINTYILLFQYIFPSLSIELFTCFLSQRIKSIKLMRFSHVGKLLWGVNSSHPNWNTWS